MIDQRPIKLTPKEFELLLYLVQRPNQVLKRDQLLEGVWGFDYAGQSRMVDIHISHLRDKIETDPKNPAYLKTVRGFGYRFEAPQND
jgi:two-component system alkaline phosphatase synthesis response regulator PhoP